ncbi:MAG: glycosyltransferase family 39 protein [Acidobacteriota bacterium]|nr:glycosyltransferase family 39 protein [Acidobacteriota bacterium]
MFREISTYRRYEWTVVLFAAAIFLGCIISPPSLMDDVDAVQATIAHTMLTTGDWVTPHLDGVRYFEKPPLKYWLIASAFKLFGVHDYVARLPLALVDVLLCWLVFRMGVWAFGERAGFYAGLTISTCIGLFLFTRILIPDSQLTFAITLALWSFMRALDPDERSPRALGLLMWASIAAAVLLKGLIGALFPCGIALVYLAVTRQLLRRDTWRRLAPGWGILLFFCLALPWHILAIVRNPPYFNFSLQSGPGNYRGFFWAYFFNEHILRFINRRFPHDYDTVPRSLFWVLNLLWLFPWSVYLPTLFQLKSSSNDRASQTRLLSLCAIGLVMLFFTFSSTQEYYSMPIYPFAALLIGCGMAMGNPQTSAWVRRGNFLIIGVCTAALLSILVILAHVWNLPTPGDIAVALNSQSTSNYTLSLGHMGDLTLQSFAYLRAPLILAAVATAIGITGLLIFETRRGVIAIALMMVVFFHAARLAMVAFDPYLSSRPLASALLDSPPGKLIVSDQYYSFSSVLFYTNRSAYLLNGRVQNLEYGSNAPDAPPVFIANSDLARMWRESQRYYLLAEHEFMPRIEAVVGWKNFTVVEQSGGKLLLTNHSVR